MGLRLGTFYCLGPIKERADMSPLGDAALWGEGGGAVRQQTACHKTTGPRPHLYTLFLVPSSLLCGNIISFLPEQLLFSVAFSPPIFQVLKDCTYIHMYINTCWLDGTLNSWLLVFNLCVCDGVCDVLFFSFIYPDYIMIWPIGQLR